MPGLFGGTVVIATILWVFGDDFLRFVAGLRNAIVRGQGPDGEDGQG